MEGILVTNITIIVAEEEVVEGEAEEDEVAEVIGIITITTVVKHLQIIRMATTMVGEMAMHFI